MRYPSKVGLLLVVVAVVPVAAGGLVSARLSRTVLEAEVLELQQELARATASHADEWFTSVPRDLRRSASYLSFERAEPGEREALLRVLYRQLDYVTAVVLTDQSGKTICPPAFLEADARAQVPSDLRDRHRLKPEDIRQLSRNIPVALALKEGLAFGPPYRASDGKMRMVCAVALAAGPARWVLATEVSLGRVQQLLQRAAKRGLSAALVDGKGKVVVHATPAGASAVVGFAPPASDEPVIKRYTGGDQTLQLATAARVSGLGWGVVLEQPASQALGAVSNLGWYTLVWTGVCLLLAVGGGILLSRGVTRPVRSLAQAARTIEHGDYQLKVEVSSDDELGQLARGFNEMAAAIQAHRHELEQLNADLQRRVEERTREVHDALEQVIRSQKLGALGELSAGISHELNNPLTGILGMSQLVQTGLDEGDERREYLQDVIDQARRMRDIVEKMRRFSESPEGMEYEPQDVNQLCREALQLAGGSIERAKIELDLQLGSAVPKVKVNQPELQQALVHLIYNAVNAMSDGGRLVVKTSEVEGAVAITVKDSGVGIPQEERGKIFEPFYSPTKPATRRTGLGLSVADRIVREHEGQIRVHSTEGEGSEFTIFLPGVREELHLR